MIRFKWLGSRMLSMNNGMNSNTSLDAQSGYGITDHGGTIKRRFERKAVSVRALLHCNGKFQTTTIEDLSQGGARLRGAEGVSVGDVVLVELLNRRQLRGEVRWWLANHCGLSFTESLAENDPLLLK